MYDPLVGRFLSPDPYVQMPDNAQNFNRYSYCLNNPLKYTDPSGEILWLVIGGALIGGAVNLGMKASNGQINGWSDAFAAFGIGAMAGGIGAATGGAAFAAAGGAAGGVGGFLAGAAGGMAGTAVSAPIQSFGNNMYFGDPMMSSGEYLGSVLISGALGGVLNGWTAIRNGRRFLNGEIKQMPQWGLPANTEVANQMKEIDGPLKTTMKSRPNVGETYNCEVTTNTYYDNVVSITEGNNTNIPRPAITGYNLTKSTTDDLYHSFPAMFDKQIIDKGKLYGISGNSSMYYTSGHINGTLGIYTIGINNQTGIIYHRCFYSMDRVLNFRFP